METNLVPILALACAALAFCCLGLGAALRRERRTLRSLAEALEAINAGQLARRIPVKGSREACAVGYGVNALAAGVQRQMARQRQAARAYKQLMTGLSHDIKTPLAALTGYLEAIELQLVNGEERDEYLAVAFARAKALRHFVETLFAWVKLDAGEQVFHFAATDLHELCRASAAAWIPRWEHAGFRYTIQIPDSCRLFTADADSLNRILDNLFENVLQHSGGDRLVFTVADATDGIRLIVQDNGRGIPPEDLPHVFDRLFCGDRARRGGSGLGLASARGLVQEDGGEITAESPPGQGARFTVWLPESPKDAKS